MIQGPAQCLGCKKYEEHSNAQMLLPCPTNKHAGEGQYRTFQIWESDAPPAYYTRVFLVQRGGVGGTSTLGHTSLGCWTLMPLHWVRFGRTRGFQRSLRFSTLPAAPQVRVIANRFMCALACAGGGEGLLPLWEGLCAPGTPSPSGGAGGGGGYTKAARGV